MSYTKYWRYYNNNLKLNNDKSWVLGAMVA